MKYNLKLALRNLMRQKVGSLINIFGLSIGIAACLIIVLFVQNEISFDTHNKNYQSIYRLLEIDNPVRYPDHPVVFHSVLKENIPELHNGTILYYYDKETDFFSYENSKYVFKNVAFTNQEFFNIFTVNFIEGSKGNALNAPNKVVLSRTTAKKIFGSENPIGKILHYENRYDYEVAGVFEDLPASSHFKADLFAAIESKNELNPSMMNSWYNSGSSFYYFLPKNTNIPVLESKINALYAKHRPEDYDESKFQLQPLSEIHLYSSDTSWDSAIKGDIQIVIAFILIAIIILAIAGFNYINLSSALFEKRNRNIGIQRVMGANVKTIFVSILTESTILVLCCGIAAIIVSVICLPEFNRLMDTALVFTFSNKVLLYVFVTLIAFTILSSSIYQAWRRTQLNPIKSISRQNSLKLRGKKQSTLKSSQPFIIAQLAASIILIIGVISIYKQTSLLLDSKLGFNKSQLITIKNPMDGNVHARFKLLKEELSQIPQVTGVSGTWNVPGEYINNYNDVIVKGSNGAKRAGFGQLPIDLDFFNVIEPIFLLGRNFDPSKSTENNKVIINKKGVEMLGLSNPIGQIVKNGFNGNKNDLEIIGVIDNIQYRSLKEEIQPAIYYQSPMGLNKVMVRLSPGNISETMNKVKDVWNNVEKDLPFEFAFVDKMVEANYQKELQARTILLIMAILAISISMCGIFGLSVFIAQNRTKEIGIRKVNGAKVTEILSMLNRYFIKWVAISFVIATPIAYYAMNKWLENFAYKTTLSWWIFALAGLLALGIALLTVSWQSWKAATRNPVEALRYE